MHEAEKDALAEALGTVITDVVRTLQREFGERIAGMQTTINRLEARGEHQAREIKLLMQLSKTPAGKFEAATKALADVRSKAKSGKAKANGKGKLPVVSLTTAAIASARKGKGKTVRVRHA